MLARAADLESVTFAETGGRGAEVVCGFVNADRAPAHGG